MSTPALRPTRLKATVCELRNDPAGLEEDWQKLAEHVKASRSDLVLLPEMPFTPWLAARREPDPAAWAASVRDHQRWLERLPELGAPAVLATRPVIDYGERYNEFLAWDHEEGLVAHTHRKRYLPDEEGFWEASWYRRGAVFCPPVTLAGASVGFAICTEIWFTEPVRFYGKLGVHLLASPRATLAPTVDKWLAGGRAAAVVAGAYGLSSNFSGPAGPLGDWGGTGWVVDPDGTVLGTTSRENPFLTVRLDLGVAEAAKKTYPRYVVDDA